MGEGAFVVGEGEIRAGLVLVFLFFRDGESCSSEIWFSEDSGVFVQFGIGQKDG